MATHLTPGASGALRTFVYWLANGTVGLPLLEGIDSWSVMRAEPSLMEQAVAILANVLRLHDAGNPVNAKQAERRAAMWIRQYCDPSFTADPPLEGWEIELF